MINKLTMKKEQIKVHVSIFNIIHRHPLLFAPPPPPPLPHQQTPPHKVLLREAKGLNAGQKARLGSELIEARLQLQQTTSFMVSGHSTLEDGDSVGVAVGAL